MRRGSSCPPRTAPRAGASWPGAVAPLARDGEAIVVPYCADGSCRPVRSPGEIAREESQLPDVGRPLRVGHGLLRLAVACGASEAQAASSSCPPVAQSGPGATPSGPGPAPAAQPAPGLPQPAPEQIVACIGSRPITGAVFAHWIVVAQKSEPKSSKNQRSNATRTGERGHAVSDLLAMGAGRSGGPRHSHISKAKVRSSFERIRVNEFPKHGEFGKFLEQSGQSAADLLLPRAREPALRADSKNTCSPATTAPVAASSRSSAS